MARDTSKLVTIPGELHSAATGNIVAAAQEIYDYDAGAYQSLLNKSVYNVSLHNTNKATFTLEEAINVIPDNLKVGGLIITFISEDEGYETYQCDSSVFSTSLSDWRYFDNSVSVDNPEWLKVYVDKDNKVLFGIKVDGTIEWSAGVPKPVKEYVEEKVGKVVDDIVPVIDSSIKSLERSVNELDSSVVSIKSSISELESSSTKYTKEHFDYYNVNKHDVHPREEQVIVANSGWLQVDRDSTAYIYDATDTYTADEVVNITEDTNHSYKSTTRQKGNYPAHQETIIVYDDKLTLEQALALISDDVKATFKTGQIISFLNNESIIEKWELQENGEWEQSTSSYYTPNPEFIDVKLDAEGKIIESIDVEGKKEYNGDFEINGELYVDGNTSINGDAKINGTTIDFSGFNISFVENPEWFRVITDNEGKIIAGVKPDGSIEWSVGVPTPVKEYIEERVGKVIDEIIPAIDASINKLENHIVELDNKKVDKVEGKSLIDEEYANGVYYVQNPEWVRACIDASGHVLAGIKSDGAIEWSVGIPTPIKDRINEIIDSSISVINNEIKKNYYNLSSDGNNYTLEEAINAVPEEYRNGGLILTFNSYENGNVIYQCKLENYSLDINDWNQIANKKYVDSSINELKSKLNEEILKTSDIQRTIASDEEELISIETDSGVEITTISIKNNQDETEGIVLATDSGVEVINIDINTTSKDDSEAIVLSTNDNVEVGSISTGTTNIDDSECIEFKNENNTETYAKIGSIDGSSGLFVDNIYDLNGNIFISFDKENDVLILGGKKYKLIEYVEN